MVLEEVCVLNNLLHVQHMHFQSFRSRMHFTYNFLLNVGVHQYSQMPHRNVVMIFPIKEFLIVALYYDLKQNLIEQ